MAEEILKVKCPTCKKDTFYSVENPHRRFCSERCKLIDLGSWASDEYSVEVAPETEEELIQLITLQQTQADKSK